MSHILKGVHHITASEPSEPSLPGDPIPAPPVEDPEISGAETPEIPESGYPLIKESPLLKRAASAPLRNSGIPGLK